MSALGGFLSDSSSFSRGAHMCGERVCEAEGMLGRMEGCHALFSCLLILNVTN